MHPNLKLQIWKSGIHQNRLARMLGIDESTLSRIVNGFKEPSQQLRARIAEVLVTDERWLFESTDDATTPPAADRPERS
jgi:transcriptional regulator with XRE-family HTH domain